MANVASADGGSGTRRCMASVGLGQILRVDGERDDRLAVDGEALLVPPRVRAMLPILGGAPARRLTSTLGGEADVSVMSNTDVSAGTAMAKGGGVALRCLFGLLLALWGIAGLRPILRL